MTGGGLIALVAYGSQNVLLSGNPEMTYWYKTFRRYSHFATENVTTALEGPNELFYDQPIRLRAKIQRIGDLMSDIYFSFRIPDIFSKYVEIPTERTSQWYFQWVRFLGCAIIQNASFFVGGQKIQEVDGPYLLAKASLDLSNADFEKWRILVGDTPEVMNPADGIYAGGTNQTGYPSVFPNPNVPLGAQTNRPSIFGQDIHVPLSFWFSDATSLALPLVALQYHDCEVQITLNSIQNLYTVLDVSGYRVNPLWKMSAPSSLIALNMPEYVPSGDPQTEWRYFATDVGASIPPLNGWFLNARIQTTYVYLPDEERKVFATQPLSYLITQMTPYPFQGLFNRQLLDLYTHNPIYRMIFLPRRSDSLEYRNQFANFTNWWNFPNPPYIPTPGQTALNTKANSSGLLIPQGQMNIIRALRVLCDGNEIQEEKPVEFFTKIVPWKTLTGRNSFGIPVYNFALHSPTTQPAGSINASRIKNFQVEVDLWQLPPETNYVYDLMIYVESLNFFVCDGGMGGLKYAL
jgi:hypothetical protein